MKLLLFGGTFDPPHIGHMSILRNSIQAVKPDTVVVMPAGLPPHKEASATPAALRMQMCACFKPLFNNLVISDMEICRAGKSFTWHTVQQLKSRYPQADIYLCMGSDMLLSFTSWHEYKKLMRAVTLVVQNRHVADVCPAQQAMRRLQAQGAHIQLASGQVEDISSTQLRGAFQNREDVFQLVPPPADEIIRREKLYAASAPAAKQQMQATIRQAQQLARQKLSPRRFVHVQNVVQAAAELAQRYGADVQKAQLAAWLHDILKEEPPACLLQIMNQSGIMAQSLKRRPAQIWHGPCGAVYAREKLGIQDKDVLDAIAGHTTGRVGMSTLEKILFLADLISTERDYDGVEQLRLLAKENLNSAVAEGMRQSIAHVQKSRHPLDEEMVRALQDIQKQQAAEQKQQGE